MAHHIDAENVGLDGLRKRIEETDLVPSRASLLDGIETKLRALEQQGGVTSLAGLRRELKNSKRLEVLSTATGVDKQYLVLLRREIQGYFPKPSALETFDWLPGGELAKLEEVGIRDTAALRTAAGSAKSRTSSRDRQGWMSRFLRYSLGWPI